jgi:protein-S-isoprenylcysteine O-methyltransferase Ste14
MREKSEWSSRSALINAGARLLYSRFGIPAVWPPIKSGLVCAGQEVRVVRLLDLAERLLVVLLSIPFVIAFAVVLPAHPQFVLVAISELLAVALVLIRKPGELVQSPYAFLIAILGTAMPLLVRPIGGTALLPTVLTAVLMFGGLVLSISAKLFLNRSFGIVAANRGIKRGGPYRLVRHPMYAGYFLTQIGFLLGAFTLYNLLAYAVAWAFQVLRIVEEEKLLRRDPEYLRLTQTTRWRVVPFAF